MSNHKAGRDVNEFPQEFLTVNIQRFDDVLPILIRGLVQAMGDIGGDT